MPYYHWTWINTLVVVLTFAIPAAILYCFGRITAAIAIKKGLPPISYFWAGFLFFPIALLVVLLMPDRRLIKD